MVEVYIGMGGNIGDAADSIRSAFQLITKLPQVTEGRLSHLYKTSPVSPIPQGDYVNAVCAFQTSLSLKKLFAHLQHIEKHIGKTPKSKEAPRVIDLDILFYGKAYYQIENLVVPHPRWQERLFVLIPLSDLSRELVLDNQSFIITQMIANFENLHEEKVTLL